MARSKNSITQGLSGKFAKDGVFKTRKGKTFFSKYPDMSNVVASEHQTHNRSVFSLAVDFACGIINDPVRKAAFKTKKGEGVYHAAMREYFHLHAKTKKWSFNRQFHKKRLEMLLLSERLTKTALFVERAGMITNGDCQRLYNISKPTATRDLQALVKLKILESSGGRGSAAYYKMGRWWDDWDEIKKVI